MEEKESVCTTEEVPGHVNLPWLYCYHLPRNIGIAVSVFGARLHGTAQALGCAEF